VLGRVGCPSSRTELQARVSCRGDVNRHRFHDRNIWAFPLSRSKCFRRCVFHASGRNVRRISVFLLGRCCSVSLIQVTVGKSRYHQLSQVEIESDNLRSRQVSWNDRIQTVYSQIAPLGSGCTLALNDPLIFLPSLRSTTKLPEMSVVLSGRKGINGLRDM
jgi:hypothetical protein